MKALFSRPGFLLYSAMIFLNAFVDLGHKIIIQNTLFKSYDGDWQIILTALVNGLILLPFILMFSPSGFLADKYPKNHVMRVSAWAAVVITLLITLFYYQGMFVAAFAMTFLLAVQSAIYSPAKYGYIKELVANSQLSAANGMVQAITTVAILGGLFFFSILFEARFVPAADSPNAIMRLIAPIGWLLVAGSLLELWLAYRLPQKRPVQYIMRFEWQRYVRGQYLKNNLRSTWSQPVIRLSIIGLSVFWGVSQVMLAVFPAYAKETLAISNTVLIQGMLAFSGLGIVLGSLFASRVSKRHIELGLIPVGALGISACLLLLPTLHSATAHAINFFLIGMLGGMFIVPLNALLQFHAGKDTLGRVLAANNLIQNQVMLLFLGITVALALSKFGSHYLMVSLGIVALAGAVYTLYALPQSLVRFVLTRLMSMRYRLSIMGFDHIPPQGGVLMLGNHISFIDWAMVQIAMPRQVRFVMERSIYERWYLRWLFDLFGVVPIEAGNSAESIEIITQALNNGQVVCLFPEGAISRSGQLMEFKKGFERAAADANAVILPFYLRGLWGSRFSRASKQHKFSRRSGRMRDIIVAFGEVMPILSSAQAVKQRVFELSIDAWQQHVQTFPTLPHAWLSTVSRVGGQTAVIDSTGEEMSQRRFATAAICFSRLIKKHSQEQNVGILLPSVSAGAITNMAVLLAGKTVVNLNYTSSKEAMRAAIEMAGIRTVVTSQRFVSKLAKKGIDLDAVLQGVNVLYLETLKDEISSAQKLLTLALVRILPAPLLRGLFATRVEADSTAAILFSSGSEGTPKGVELSHRNILANLKQVSDVLNIEGDDRFMASLPLFHAFGLTITMFLPLLEGLPMVCHADPTDSVNIAKAIRRYQVTILCGTSTFLRLYANSKRVHPLMFEPLRIVVAGAERLNPDVREAFCKKFNKPIYEGYGATETTPVASVNLPDQLDARYWKVQQGQKLGTVGMPLPGTAFRIVDPDSLQSLPAGEDGLILIGGVQVMRGYLKDEEKTHDAVVELDDLRWYKTGDKGHLDQDGFLTIVDRYSRFAKIGGEMISLSAVEEQVRRTLEQPELEMVAVNLPDSKKGEQIVLLVSGDEQTDAIRQRLLSAKCNPSMVPAKIYEIPEVPKLGSGKTDFHTAGKMALAMLG